MSKVLIPQNSLPQNSRNTAKTDNHKTTTPTINVNAGGKAYNSRNSSSNVVKNANGGCERNVNGSISSRNNINAAASSSGSPSTSSSPVTVDFDDFTTSSSILEFLAREQECCTDVDAESIFQEVSRLADNSDTRSVDEILREAELLIQQQNLLGSGRATEQVNATAGSGTRSKGKLQQQQQQKPLQSIKNNGKSTQHKLTINSHSNSNINGYANVDASGKEIGCNSSDNALIVRGYGAFPQKKTSASSLSPAKKTSATLASLLAHKPNTYNIIDTTYTINKTTNASTPTSSSTPTLTPLLTPTPQTPTPSAATPVGGVGHFTAFVDNLPSVSVISEESTPKDMQNATVADTDVTTTAQLLNGDDEDNTEGTDTMEEITAGMDTMELMSPVEGQPNIANTFNSATNESNNENMYHDAANEAQNGSSANININCTMDSYNSSTSAAVPAAVAAAAAAAASAAVSEGYLSMSTTPSVMSTPLRMLPHLKYANSGNNSGSNSSSINNNSTIVNNNCIINGLRRPSCDALQQQTQLTAAVLSSSARRPPLNFSTSQLCSVSIDQQQHQQQYLLLERRNSGDGGSGSRSNSASLRRASMTMTPDSGISQTQSIHSSGPYSPHRSITSPVPAITIFTPKIGTCDKSVNSSPKRYVSALCSPIEPLCNVGREHVLKQDIEQLQERLKDTEERLQSLRIQHDSLSQLHRDLRENNTKLQEESEILKLDVQHLNECANILRSELQTARADRHEAQELQKSLQADLEESRMEKKRVQEQKEKDAKTIQDLQRQCREMERILMRKHPDSVSALIVASKNTGKCGNNDQENMSSRKLLEQRIAQLEADAKEQDLKAQQILANVQARFNSVQSKYETHIADLETQVLSLQEINSKLNEKIESQVRRLKHVASKKAENYYNNCTQTDLHVESGSEAGSSSDITKVATNAPISNGFNNLDTHSATSIATQTPPSAKNTRDHGTNTIGTSATASASSSTSSTANSTPNTSRPNSKQSGIRKPIATAMGSITSALASRLPVSHSDTVIMAHSGSAKEDAHLLATIRGMRVDLAIKDKAVQRLTRELEECKKTIKKLQREKEALKGEKSQWNSYNSSLTTIRRSHELVHNMQDVGLTPMPANTENHALKEAQNKVKLLEADYKSLHEKRLQDLKILQSAHERELATCHETVRLLQARINEREDTIAAAAAATATATQKRRKIPVDYYALKAKVSSLERRHSEREERLRMLVEALSKGRLSGPIEELLADNNNQRST